MIFLKKIKFNLQTVIIVALLFCPSFLSAAETVIESDQAKLIMNFNGGLNIGDGDSLRLVYTGSTADPSALLRDSSGNPSYWGGSFWSNYSVVFVNPNGITIGANANIQAASFIASTLDITDDNFLHPEKYNNSYIFSKWVDKVGKSVINNGYIKVRENGQAVLLGSAVANAGTIEATLGSVALASGEAITLGLDSAGMISVVIDQGVQEEIFTAGSKKLASAVENSGIILADGGKVVLAAKVLNKVFDYAVNNSGVIQANSLVNHKGVIELVGEGDVAIKAVVNTGSIIANGSLTAPDAGKITLNGLDILQQGKILANAQEEGTAGEVEIVSENSTVVNSGSSTEARALGIIGNGGRVRIDSTGGNTVVNTNAVIDVSAGTGSGNAGFIEVSAFDQLGFYGILNGRAPPGYQTGTAILDPTDADIGPADITVNTTIWAENNITIYEDIALIGPITLNLFAGHKSDTSGDWHDGAGQIINNSSYTITGTSATLNLKAGDGIGTPDSPIKTDVFNLSAEINPDSSGDIYLSQGSTDLNITSLTTPSGTVNLSSLGAIIDGNGSLNNIAADNLILSAVNGIGSTDALETQVSSLQATNTNNGIWITNTGSLNLDNISGEEGANAVSNTNGWVNISANGSDIEDGIYLDINSPVTASGDITLEANNTVTVDIEGDDFYEDDSENYAEININGAISSTGTGNIEITATNTVERTITADSYVDYYEDYSTNYAEIEVNSPISATTGSITLLAKNEVGIDLTVDGDIGDGYYDYSQNEAYITVSGDGAEDFIQTDSGAISLTAENNYNRDISAGYIEYLYLGYDDSQNNRAYIDVEDAEVTSNTGNISLIAKNDITQNITADYIDYLYDYTDNEAYIYLYSPIYSQAGNVTLEASNTIDTTVKATADGDSGIEKYEDYPYNYSYININDVISTSGNIDISALNTIIRDVTSDYIGYFDDEPYNYAYLYSYNEITTAQFYDGEDLINVEDGDGEISLTADNNTTTDLKVTGDIDIYSAPYNDAKIYVYNSIITDLGNTTLTAEDVYLNSSVNWVMGNSLTVNGNLTISSGAALDANGYDITVSGDWINDNGGTFTPSEGTVTLTGTDKQITGSASDMKFATLIVDGTYTNNITTGLTILTALDGSGNLTREANTVLNISGTSDIATLTATALDNTVNYNGVGDQTVKTTDYYNLTVSTGGIKTVGHDNTTISGAGTINDTAQVLLTVNATGTDKTYDGDATATVTLSVNNIFTDYIVFPSDTYTATFDAGKNVGTDKTISVSGISLTGVNAAKFTLSATTASTTAEITARTLNLSSFTVDNKVYDGNTDVSGTGFSDDRVEGDELEFTYSAAFADKNAGSAKTVDYTDIVISGGLDQGNYVLAATSGTATADIDLKDLTVTGITANNKVFDGNTTAVIDTSSAALVGVIEGDDVALDTDSAAGSFSDKNVDNNKTVTISDLTIEGEDVDNYTLTQPTTAANITPAELTVTGINAANKVYDGTTDAMLYGIAVLNGVIEGDTVKLDTAGATGTFADSSVGVGKTVTVSGLVLSGTANLGNYILTQPTATADITAANTNSNISNSLLSNGGSLYFISPDAGSFGQFQFNTFNPPGGPVYFYHPLTPMDISAFDALTLGDDAYQFIGGSINILGHDGLLPRLMR